MKIGDIVEVKVWGEWFHPVITKIDTNTITVHITEMVRGIDEEVTVPKNKVIKSTL